MNFVRTLSSSALILLLKILLMLRIEIGTTEVLRRGERGCFVAVQDGVRVDHRVVQTTVAHAITVTYFPPVRPHLALDVLDYFPVRDE